MHDLKVERFYNPRMEGGMLITAQGPIKTFPLRGIKESPPYLHDGRLLTLEDAVEKLRLDLYYVKNLSLFLDLCIIMKTCKIVVFGKGAR